ncbi:MAG TPA: TlpA disulfide reductase family protein [Ktedonobacterales bacterium]|nr:TlpA disulfide reductase family protein [Ktedonobacterales bacterium]
MPDEEEQPVINKQPSPANGNHHQPRRARREWMTRWVSAGVALVVAGLIIGGLFASRAGAPGKSAGGPTLPDFYGLAGQHLTNFTLTDVTNKRVSLDDFRGQPVLLNFWYVACAPCREEMPDLETFSHQPEGQHVAILGINIQDDPLTASEFLQQLGITYSVVLDPHQRVFDYYRLTSTPSSMLIDSQGMIRGSVSGPLSLKQLETYFATIH